jgi:hypothetical protein
MNQQRSRRFRSAQEAKDKEEARKESVALWECAFSLLSILTCLVHFIFIYSAMGKEISDEDRNKESWDSNAITPGTPFMDLLASSLRYWVVHKINTDSGWKTVGLTQNYRPVVSNQIYRCKSSSLMLVFREKGSIKLWISSESSVVTQVMTPIPATSYMVWYVALSFSWFIPWLIKDVFPS